jgi:hypothetical protein
MRLPCPRVWAVAKGPARALCLLLPGAVVLAAMMYLWQQAHTDGQCIMSMMAPLYRRVPLAPAVWPANASLPFSLRRYRDQMFNDEFGPCLAGTPLLFVPGHGGR